MLSPDIIDEKLQQYMNITLSYANIWVDYCMTLFLSDDATDIEGFMSYSIFVEQNIEASIS